MFIVLNLDSIRSQLIHIKIIKSTLQTSELRQPLESKPSLQQITGVGSFLRSYQKKLKMASEFQQSILFNQFITLPKLPPLRSHSVLPRLCSHLSATCPASSAEIKLAIGSTVTIKFAQRDHLQVRLQLLCKILVAGKNELKNIFGPLLRGSSEKINQMFTIPFIESLTKTFVFQKEETQQSTMVECKVSLNSTLIDISALLLQHCPPTQFAVCIYDPEANKFVSLQKIKAQKGLIPRHFLQPSVILVRYRKMEERQSEENQQSSFELDSKVKRDLRSKQRSIREAIALVKRWRELNNNAPKPGNTAKRMNLQDAARQIGISKKSLDDYYCQLRLAQLHNFNFPENMDQRMGKLRSYVKQHRTDESVRIRHHKHPKNLRVIEEFVVDPKMEEYILHERELGEEERMKEESEMVQIQEENPFLNQFSSHKIFDNLEDDYYKGFQFILDQPSDPFLCDNANFNKKMFEDDSEGSLFF